MPHSLPLEENKNPVDEDTILPDAPPMIAEAADADAKDDLDSSCAVKASSNGPVKLEDLFDDDEEDEEFPSSAITDETAPGSSPPATVP